MSEDEWENLKYSLESASSDFDDLDAEDQWAMSFDSFQEYEAQRMADHADMMRKRAKEHGT